MIVVTGGAGFIGSNIVKGLNDAGEEDILVVDNLSNAEKHLNLNSLSIADYLDKDDYLNSLNKFQNVSAIFHQGACSSTTEQDGKYMMSNNQFPIIHKSKLRGTSRTPLPPMPLLSTLL